MAWTTTHGHGSRDSALLFVGPSTGHIVLPVAFCDKPERADGLATLIGAARAIVETKVLSSGAAHDELVKALTLLGVGHE